MRTLSVTFLVMLVALLSACGGSGGNGGGGISYTGLTTHAQINDAQSASDLTEQAYYGSDLDSTLPIMSLQGGGSVSVEPQFVILELAKLTKDLPALIELSEGGQTHAASASGSEPCYNEGGTVSFSGTETETYIKASVSFNSCDLTGEGLIFNGKFSMEADLDIDGEPISFNVGMSTFSIEWPDINEQIVMSGSMTGTFSGATESLTLNLVVSDTFSSDMMMLEDYTVTLVDMGSHYDMTISGTVYSGAHGYVVLSTPLTIELDYFTEEPQAGVFRIDGANDSWAQYDFGLAEGTFDNGAGVTGVFYIDVSE